MRIFDHLLRHLQLYFGDLPYAVYLQTSRDRKLRLLHREPALNEESLSHVNPSNEPVHRQEGARYTVKRQEDGWFFHFFYEDDVQALIVLPCRKNAGSTLTPEQMELLWVSCKLVMAEHTIRSKNEEWSKLLQSIRSITSKLDVESIIREIIGNALAVIPAADAGLLHLYDPGLERLIPKATVGFADRVLHDFKLRIGESIAGKVYQDGMPRLYRTHPETTQGMLDLSTENYQTLNEAKELANLHGLLCVPISLEQTRIGVLVLHQFHEDNIFSEYDLTILQGFADQTAIALQNAQLYADTRTAYENMTSLSMQLQAKHDDLIKRNNIHESLKLLSLQNKGTTAIVHALGRMTGKRMFFADWLEQRFYPENTPSVFSWDELSMLFANQMHAEPIQVRANDLAGEHRFILYPLMNGSVFLGCMLVQIDDQPLSELERVTIEQGSSVLTLDLVKKQSLSSVMYKRTHDIFQELLTSKGVDLQERAQALGLNDQTNYVAVFAYLTRCADFAKLEASIHRLIAAWKWNFGNEHVLSYGFHNHVTMVLQVSGETFVPEMIVLLQSEAGVWDRGGEASLAIGAGSVYAGFAQIGKSFEEAKKAAHSLMNRNRSGAVRYRELGINRLMLNQSREDIEAFIHDVFGPMKDDHEKYMELEHTLHAYIRCNQSPQQAARELHIHVNTLYQRLRKIEELIQIDLGHPEDLLKVQLACHLRQM